MVRKVAKPARRHAKQPRAQQTIAVVLDAAAQVLQRRGYAGATTNRIAERAGVSVGTIYQYFADKDQIFDQLIQREIEGLIGLLRRVAFDPGAPIADGLRRMLRLLVEARPDAPVLYRALEHVPEGLFRRRVAAARGRVIALTREFLAAHRSEIHVSDLDIASFVLVTAAEGVAMSSSAEFYRERCTDELTLAFTRYLTGRGT